MTKQGLVRVLAVVVLCTTAPAAPSFNGLPPSWADPVLPTKEIAGKDGAEMVLVPAGEFWMGGDDGKDDEEPRHKVWVDAFYIDKYEVTNALYNRFVEATGHAVPSYWRLSRFNAPSQPAVGVSWRDADAYCKWAGKRLPTEAEWEKAARGTDGRRYPWGDDWDRNKANSASYWARKDITAKHEMLAWWAKDEGAPTSVGSFEGGKSPFGVHDMAGNASEWVADWYSRDYYRRSPERNPHGPETGHSKVLRGGAWSSYPTLLRTTDRFYYAPSYRSGITGFRCVTDQRAVPVQARPKPVGPHPDERIQIDSSATGFGRLYGFLHAYVGHIIFIILSGLFTVVAAYGVGILSRTSAQTVRLIVYLILLAGVILAVLHSWWAISLQDTNDTQMLATIARERPFYTTREIAVPEWPWWRPVNGASFVILDGLWGWSHVGMLVNSLLLFATTGMLVGTLAYLLFKSRTTAIVATVIYSLNPVLIGRMSANFRADVLMMVFSLASLLTTYSVCHRGKKDVLPVVALFGSAVLAYCSKESGYAVIPLSVLLTFYLDRRSVLRVFMAVFAAWVFVIILRVGIMGVECAVPFFPGCMRFGTTDVLAPAVAFAKGIVVNLFPSLWKPGIGLIGIASAVTMVCSYSLAAREWARVGPPKIAYWQFVWLGIGFFVTELIESSQQGEERLGRINPQDFPSAWSTLLLSKLVLTDGSGSLHRGRTFLVCASYTLAHASHWAHAVVQP